MGTEGYIGKNVGMNMGKKKVILAFSGGLDTSFAVVYLNKQGYEVVTVTVNTGGFTQEELRNVGIHRLGENYGSHYGISCEDEFFDKVISKIIKTNALYEGKYPLLCADRYIIAEKIVEIAKKEKAQAVAHGSTAMGNDQIRFDSAFACLAPELVVLSPIKEAKLSRKEEIEFLKKNGVDVKAESKKYSINQNLVGVTISGSEIDEYQEPSEEIYKLTKFAAKDKKEYIKLSFESGMPLALNDKKMKGSVILKKLNEIIGSYGWGREIYTGNCIIGIKGRIVFEAPGLLALINAHQALEQITLTKTQMDINAILRVYYANHIYNGLYFDPVVKNLEQYFESNQKNVTGEVILKIEPYCLSISSIKSPNSLVNRKIASYAQSCSWTKEDADGFIKLFTLQEKLANIKK